MAEDKKIINWDQILQEASQTVTKANQIDDYLLTLLATRTHEHHITDHMLPYAEILSLQKNVLAVYDTALSHGITHRLVNRDPLGKYQESMYYLETEYLVRPDNVTKPTNGTISSLLRLTLVSQTLQQAADGVFAIHSAIPRPLLPDNTRYTFSPQNLTVCHIRTSIPPVH